MLDRRAPHLLAKNGGLFTCSRSWMRLFISKSMGWTYQMPTTCKTSMPENWVEQGRKFAGRLAVAVKVYNILLAFVVNADQSGMALVPVFAERTYNLKGMREIGITGRNDKRSVTTLPTFSAGGHLLPMQVIFSRKTERSTPGGEHAEDAKERGWHITATEAHWSTLETMQQWVEKIVLPYYTSMCSKYNKAVGKAKFVCILDTWSVHKSKKFIDWIQDNYKWIMLLFVPPNCTGKLQPCDIILQRPFKGGQQRAFDVWAAKYTTDKISRNESPSFSSADMRIGPLRCLALESLLKIHAELEANPSLLRKGWEKAGLLRAWDPEFQNDPQWWEEFDSLGGTMTGLSDSGLGFEQEPTWEDFQSQWDGDEESHDMASLCVGFKRPVDMMHEDDDLDDAEVNHMQRHGLVNGNIPLEQEMKEWEEGHLKWVSESARITAKNTRAAKKAKGKVKV